MVKPSPVQARAYATVRQAIDAAATLIEERGEDRVRIQDVVERSGVSAGSLGHHFGDREGLLAAALMERFDRAAEARDRSFALDASDPARFADAMARMVASSAAGERDAWRLARIRALAYARHRPELRAAIVASLGNLERGMAARAASTPASELLGPSVSPRALVVFSETYSAGRLVDTVFGPALPEQDWFGVFSRFARTFSDSRELGAALSSLTGLDRTDRSATLSEDRPVVPWLGLDDDERRAVGAAAELERAHGAEAVKLNRLVEMTGLSRSWFGRHLGEREEIVDLVRLADLVAFSKRETQLIEAAFDEAADGEDLARRLGDVVAVMSSRESLDGAWGRLQLVASSAGRPELASQAAPIIHAVLGRTSSAIAGSQARGLVHADLSPQAVARFLWAAPLAFVLGEVAEVEWSELLGLGRRAARALIVASATGVAPAAPVTPIQT